MEHKIKIQASTIFVSLKSISEQKIRSIKQSYQISKVKVVHISHFICGLYKHFFLPFSSSETEYSINFETETLKTETLVKILANFKEILFKF